MTTPQQQSATHNNPQPTNGAKPAKKPRQPPKPMTAIEALAKIGKILERVSEADRVKVLAFVGA